jgi:hypothetical protein
MTVEPLTAKELWLTTITIDGWVPLRWLAASNLSEIFNRGDPGFTTSELLETLDRLFQRGDLVTRWMNPDDPVADLVVPWMPRSHPVGEPFTPTRAEVAEALAGRLPVRYGLSAQGGARWELVAQPRWDKFIDAWVWSEPGWADVTAGTRLRVEQYLAIWAFLWNQYAIVAGSETWEVVQPWQATYWKTLPIGHRVRLQLRAVEPIPVERPPGFREWFREFRRWYTLPAATS